MDDDVVTEFVAQVHYLVTVPAYRASLGFLAAASRGNPKYASFKNAADLYLKCTEDEKKSINDFTYSAIHYACFSFLDFLEEYSAQNEANENKRIQLILIDTSDDSNSVDLIAASRRQLRTIFRRFVASEEWKLFLSGLASDGGGSESKPV